MDNITKKYGYNVLGVRDILFIDMDKVTSIPDVSPTQFLIDMSAMVVAVDWNVAMFTRFSAKFIELEFEKNGKIWYRVTITFFVAQDTALRWKGFNEMKYHEFCVAVRDNNNRSRLCGYINLQGEKRGMTFKTELATEKVNGYDCTFTMEAPERAIHCNLIGEVTVIVDPPPPNDDDTDIGTID